MHLKKNYNSEAGFLYLIWTCYSSSESKHEVTQQFDFACKLNLCVLWKINRYELSISDYVENNFNILNILGSETC